jgi:hypothetical protein
MAAVGRTIQPEEGRLYTAEFRLYGLLHIPRNVGAAWLMNMQDRPYLPVTRCMVYDSGIEHPPSPSSMLYETEFAAIPKGHILWALGGNPDERAGSLAREARRVFVMFESYVLSGALYLPPKQRVSDFLSTVLGVRPFVNLFEARVLVPRPGVPLQQLEPVQEHPFVTVNLKQAGGIFDVHGSPGQGFRIEQDEAD